jgi:hypothetical protein
MVAGRRRNARGISYSFPKHTNIEPLEGRRLLTGITITNQGPAHDSLGNTTSGWTGFLITINADVGQNVGAVDMGQFANSANGIFGTMLQAWPIVDGESTPTPVSANATDTNGTNRGTDSHVLVTSGRLDVAAPFEDSNGVHPTGAPANTATKTWGTGTYLRGEFGVTPSGELNRLPLAYVVLKDGTTGSYAMDVAEAAPGHIATQTHLSGKIIATAVLNGSISGTVFNDIDGNGTRGSSEPVLSGATIYIDANNNGVYDAGEMTAMTATDGTYKFTGLGPGGYRVRLQPPDSQSRTSVPAIGYRDYTLSSASPTVTGADFASTKTGLLSGVVFNDNYIQDGTLESNEPGLAGWTVFLDQNQNGVVDAGEPTTMTDSTGRYTFVLQPPWLNKNLFVGEVVQSGWRSYYHQPRGVAVSVSAGSTLTNWNLPNIYVTTKASIQGTVYNDVNGNGLLDSADSPLSGETVYVDSNNNGVLDSGEPSTTSAADGTYKFIVSVALGGTSFVIRQAPRSGWRQSMPAGNAAVKLTLQQGDFGFAASFADTQRILISGRLFNDVNGNAALDSGEGGLSAVRIFVDTNNDGVWESTEPSTRTDSHGYWSLGTLPAGTYTIRVVKVTGWTQTTSLTPPITLSVGGSKTGVLIGLRKTS